MTRRLHRSLGSTAAALAAAVLLSGAAAAHEGAPPIALDPPTVPPGGTVTVRFEDRSADEVLDVALVSGDGRLPLGSVTVDGEGHAVAAVALPVDLPPGLYAVSGVDAGGATISAALAVEGTPVLPADEEPGGRDEDDPLLLPLPSGWQQSLGGPAITARPVTGTSGGAVTAAEIAPAALAVLAVAAIAGVLGGVALARRRR